MSFRRADRSLTISVSHESLTLVPSFSPQETIKNKNETQLFQSPRTTPYQTQLSFSRKLRAFLSVLFSMKQTTHYGLN
uniref:Uncharacterized protein n=1 Tax=Salix viminalis TaxID=40686 RepID=A0A6N2NLB0_SALVM